MHFFFFTKEGCFINGSLRPILEKDKVIIGHIPSFKLKNPIN
jgi:hypothetical protein